MFENFIHTILDFVLPPRCLGCKRPAQYLCTTCIREIPRADTIDLEHSYALFTYHDPRVKKLIWKLKYHGLTAVAPRIASLLHDLILPDLAEISLFEAGKVLLVPIPITSKRQKERGFNQAAVLAKHLARKNPESLIYAPNILQKTKDTPTQVSIKNRAERLKNLAGAFAVTDPDKVKNQTILILDDVITTGTTVREARRVLLQSNAKKVLTLAVAHG